MYVTLGLLQTWLEAIEEHSAYSTHYCSQDQVTDEEEEDAVSPMDLKEALEVSRHSSTSIPNSVMVSGKYDFSQWK